MKLVIDASNLRRGGGITHLEEVLRAAKLNRYEIECIDIWAPTTIAKRIGRIEGVDWRHHELIERGRLGGFLFRLLVLDQMIDESVDLLWVPGGTYVGRFRPYVTMVRNFLPFDKRERDRFLPSLAWVRLKILSIIQKISFSNATGLIHLSEYSTKILSKLLNESQAQQRVIPHGLSDSFARQSPQQRDLEDFTTELPARVLYVSTLYNYKHQRVLAKAVHKIRQSGIPVVLELVGSAYSPELRRLSRLRKSIDPEGIWLFHRNDIPYSQMPQLYAQADIFVFLSSCETFGNILIEAMGSGLPILCSNRSALPEINGGTCPEVDPEDVEAVAAGLEQLIRDKALRERCARAAHERAKTFTWEKCADQTFKFLAECAKR